MDWQIILRRVQQIPEFEWSSPGSASRRSLELTAIEFIGNQVTVHAFFLMADLFNFTDLFIPHSIMAIGSLLSAHIITNGSTEQCTGYRHNVLTAPTAKFTADGTTENSTQYFGRVRTTSRMPGFANLFFRRNNSCGCRYLDNTDFAAAHPVPVR